MRAAKRAWGCLIGSRDRIAPDRMAGSGARSEMNPQANPQRAGVRGLARDTPVLALAVTAAVYLRCIHNEFVFDDKEMITGNRFIGDWAMVTKSFVRDSWWFRDPNNLPQSAYYRPLQDVWLALSYHLFGFALPGWHLAVIAIHLVAVWLVFRIARALTSHRWAPLLAATLFGLMPVHAQAVVWPIAIPLPMSTAFMLAGFLAFIGSRGGGAAHRPLALIFFGLALLSHESAAVFPFLLLAYVAILQPDDEAARREESMRELLWRGVIETWPFLALLAGYLMVRLLVLGVIVRSHVANPMTLAQLLITLPSALATYVWLLVAPWSAGPDHPVVMVSSILSRDFLVPLAMLAVLALAAALLLRHASHRRLYVFCVAWIAIGLAPVLNLREFPPLVMVQDRYLYLSSVAWCLMIADIAVTICEWVRLGSAAIAAAGALLAVLYGGILFHVESFWRDDVALFSTCLQMFPASWECHYELGTALLHRKDLDGAEPEFRAALDSNPDFPGALVNLAMVLEQTGRTSEALGDIRQALVLMPQWVHGPGPYIDLARNLNQYDAVDLRESALEAAAKLPGGSTAVAKERAEIALGHQDYTAAEILMRSVIAQEPDDAEALTLLAVALERQGKIAEATAACRKALALKPAPDLSDVLEKMVARLGA
jgi:Flp pilus assembly protein TadD